MEINENVTKSFVLAITDKVSKKIAIYDRISIEQAKSNFINSKVYEYLCNPQVSFIEEGPDYFFELYENLKNEGVMVDNTTLYLKQHPELYTIPDEKH